MHTDRSNARSGWMASTFRSLGGRNFRLYYLGQMASMCGTWTQTVALAWLVLRLTGSGTGVGLVIAVQFVPVLLFGALGGVVADRFDNRKAVMAVQGLLGVQAAVLATIVLTDMVQLWMVYGLAAVQGFGVALDTPTRQSLVGQLVGNADLSNALSLNASLVQLGRIVGPATAGALIETVGIGVCFAINAVSYVVILAVVSALDPSTFVRRPRVPAGRGQVREGFRYVLGTPALRDLLLLTFIVSTASVSFTVGLPLMARFVFDGDAGTYGLLASTQGLGALVGTLVIASRRATKGFVVGTVGLLSVGLVATAGAPSVSLAVVALLLAGMMSLSTGVTLNAAMQIGCRPEMRGRVIAMYFLVAYGSNVVGGPVVGWIAETWGSRWAFAAGGTAVMVAASLLALRWRGRLGEAPAVYVPAAQTPALA